MRRKQRIIQEDEEEDSESDEEPDESEVGSDSETEDEVEQHYNTRKKFKKGKTLKSGIFAKSSNTRIISHELFAHATLDDEVGGDRDLKSLSFNLFMAGELEIITSEDISKHECNTRLEVLKKLAYKHEFLSKDEVINQYASFIKKVEKGKFRWDSELDLQKFEHQLVYSISIDNRKSEKSKGKKEKPNKWEDSKKYCLDFNRGNCRFDDSHEGRLGNQTVFKLHVCKACLVNENVEARHAEKDCPKK